MTRFRFADALKWLDDFDGVSQDAIPLACVQFLGTDRVSQLAASAELEAEWFSASLRWSAAAIVSRITDGSAAALPLLKLCAAALEHVKPATAIEEEAKAALELPSLVLILLGWNPDDLAVYVPRVAALMSTKAAKERVEFRSAYFLMNKFYPDFFGVVRKGLRNAEEQQFGRLALQYVSMFLEAVRAGTPGSRRHRKLLALCYSFNGGSAFLDMMSELPEFDWDHVFGVNGQLLCEASRAYDFDTHHKP